MICGGCHGTGPHFTDCPRRPLARFAPTTPAAPIATNQEEGHTVTRIIITAPAGRLGSIPALLQEIGRKIDADERFDPDADGFGYRREHGDVSTILPARVKRNGNTVAAFEDMEEAANYIRRRVGVDLTEFSITFETEAV